MHKPWRAGLSRAARMVPGPACSEQVRHDSPARPAGGWAGELVAGAAALWCKTAVIAMSRPQTCEAAAAARSGDRVLKNIIERR